LSQRCSSTVFAVQLETDRPDLLPNFPQSTPKDRVTAK